jgi:hypothetical protein
MPKKWTHADCFAYFNTVPKNPRWSWSGRSVDGTIVAVTLWQDQFEDKGVVYRNSKHDVPGEWRTRPGFVELIENLAYARDHLDGVVRIILARPKDPDARPRAIKHCFPHEKMRMKVFELDTDAGTFKLEQI